MHGLVNQVFENVHASLTEGGVDEDRALNTPAGIRFPVVQLILSAAINFR